MHNIEREIIKLTKYKVERKYDDRQDYLRSVLLSVQNLDGDKFDELSDDAAAWANACVELENTKRGAELPDFDEVDPAEPDDEDVLEYDEDESADSEPDEDASDEPDPDDEDEEAPGDGEPEGDDDSDDDAGDAALDDDDEPEVAEDADPEPEDEGEADPAPKKRPSKKQPAKKPAAKKAKAPKVPPKPKKYPEPPKRPRDGDVKQDKWGCIVGSKTSAALTMFELGSTPREIKEKLGGTYYNILKRMVADGHRLEKYGSVTKLVHKDNIKVSSPKKSKQK